MTAAELDALARRFSFGAQEFVSSPLYQRLCLTTAADPELLAIAARCRAGQQPTNLFLAAVHFLLLGGAGPELAAFYPSVVGASARAPEGIEPVFRAFCLAQREALVALVSTRLVQTNVVARSAALRLGLAVVARRCSRPVTLLEVGCSAGVHLYFDRYQYRIAGRVWGSPGSPVQIVSEWRGAAPPPDLARLPAIAGRIGVDLNPVDAADPEPRRWLRALVWPENGAEAALLTRALDVVAAERPRIVAGDALAVLPLLGQELPAEEPLVVFHAATRAHVPQELRPQFDGAIAALGQRRPLFWLSLEGSLHPDPRVPAGLPAHVLALRQLDGETRTEAHLALVEGHAEWLQPLDL